MWQTFLSKLFRKRNTLSTQWHPIKGYERLYEINEDGEIRSLHSRNLGKIISRRIGRGGYLTTRLSKNDKTFTHFVHRLLGMQFIANTENKPYINHLDGNKQNNALNNLEWITHRENVIHAYVYGLNSSAKRVLDSISGTIYRSIREAANAVGVNYNTCCKHLEKDNPLFRLSYLR